MGVRKLNTHKKGTLNNKKVYLVVTAARKAYLGKDMTLELVSEGAEVYVFLTEKANKIISTSLFDNIPNCKVVKDFNWGNNPEKIPEEDIVIVAPCTFNTLSKIRFGIADNYATTIISAAISKKKKVYVAPAFNEYWYHPLTKDNLSILTSWGVRIIWPEITSQKVTMIDYGKILDTVYAENHKIRFNSAQIYSEDLSALLDESREKYFNVFNSIGKNQHAEGSNSSTHGCYSVKVNDEWLLITCSGSSLTELNKDDLTMVKISKDDEITWVGDKLPSSETPLHLIFYCKTNYSALLHSHCPKLTYSSQFENLATPQYVRYGNLASVEDLDKQTIKQKGFVILKFHGEVAVGSDLHEAYKNLKLHFDKVGN